MKTRKEKRCILCEVPSLAVCNVFFCLPLKASEEKKAEGKGAGKVKNSPEEEGKARGYFYETFSRSKRLNMEQEEEVSTMKRMMRNRENVICEVPLFSLCSPICCVTKTSETRKRTARSGKK